MSNTLKYILVGVAGVVIGFLALLSLRPEKTSSPTGGTTNYGGSLTVEDLTTQADTTHGTTGALSVAGASTLTGSSTPAQLIFAVGGTISTSATGTAITLYANTTGPKLCFGGTGALAARNVGNFSPLQTVSIGTSTASVTTRNLIASTTIATSTPGTSFFQSFSFTDSEFVLQNGDELMAITGTGDNADSSSTNLTNLTLDARILCSEIAI